jgi:UDP-N-acetylmuramoylalanine--D-glutamate ligase
MAVAMGCAPEAALRRASEFPGVPHRFQFIGIDAGVELVDDSKATTMHAVRAALESLAERTVVLILGGAIRC